MATKKKISLRKTNVKVEATANGGICITISPQKAAHLMQRLEKQHGVKVQKP